MFAKSKKIVRQYIGKDIQDFMELPNLIDIQLSSYEEFIQKGRIEKGEPLLNQGLQEVFTSTFPIESPAGDMSLEYEFYELDYDGMKFTEQECKKKGVSYAVPLKARINLNFKETGAILQRYLHGRCSSYDRQGNFCYQWRRTRCCKPDSPFAWSYFSAR